MVMNVVLTLIRRKSDCVETKAVVLVVEDV